MSQRPIIVAGNWKLSGTIPETEALISALLSSDYKREGYQVLVCPPYPSLQHAASLLTGSAIALGAQDVSAHEKGAYTGEVSADMLLTVGVSHVILGHSERRQYHEETDELVNQKARLVLSKGLTPIICVGETLDQRESGATDEVVGRQLRGTLADFESDMVRKTIIAYEPVWAIGTGKTATPEMAQEVHRFIREKVAAIDGRAAEALPILYGGSVKPGNAAGLFAQLDIDGGLIGGASLQADDFIGIIQAA